MASQQKGEEDQPTSSPPAAGFGEMAVERYRKIREHAETYPYVWASYVVVYGGLGLWATYRWRKLRKTEDRVRALQERLRKLVETQEGASSARAIASMADHGEYETITFPGGVVAEMTASKALNHYYIHDSLALLHLQLLPPTSIAGGRIDLVFMTSQTNVVMLVVIVVLACSAKVWSSFLVCKAFGISARDAIPLGVLMKTKGLLALIVIGIGQDVQALDNVAYPAMVIVFVVMTALVKPFPYWASQSSKNLKKYNRRTIETSNEDSELRIILCVHESHHLSGISTLLKFSNSTKRSPISIFALHLVELTGRSSAMLIVHDAYNCSNLSQPIFERVLSDHTESHSFGSKGSSRTSHPISIQPVTVVSPYATMHGDICSVAEDKHVTFIPVPFHKEGVGVIVDRGLKSEILDKGNLGTQQFNVTMLFTGGPDNLEALAYAWRMAGSYVVRLTVLHFQLGEKAKSTMEEVKESENDEQLDDKYVNEFRFKAMCNDRVTYLEKVANNGEDIIRATKEMFDFHDLIYSRQGSRSAISFQYFTVVRDLKHARATPLPVAILMLQKLRRLLVYRYEIDSDDQTPTKCGFKAREQIRCLHESLQKLCFLEENQSNILMRELGRLNQLRRLDIVKFRKRAGRALCSSIEMLINLRPLSEVYNAQSPDIFNPVFTAIEVLSWISSLQSSVTLGLRWSRLSDDPIVVFPGQGFQRLKVSEFSTVPEELIMTLHPNRKDGDYLKVAYVPEVCSTY
ncbi:hypothetical protein POTOM_020749 [Populus tomentosa]|uniref:Cation/H+ exchanger transmembrane domain-containing protein n=1 Tax=Populus tomentosa TaxID=118781 RepID=A0A8X7ZQP0_POPTO|nr:hypothetical protein POTOM_020749 [Populus tomentosa]